MVEANRQMNEILEAYADQNPLPLESLEPALARQLPELRDAVFHVLGSHAAKRIVQNVLEPVESIEHILIPGPESMMLARVYRPNLDPDLPVLLYFHGGGFVIANLNTYDSSCRALANAAGCIVLSLAYRQAPEHRFPAAPEDAFAAYRWLLAHASLIGGDPHRVAVAGESAGGNLATVVCLKARSKRLAQPVHQLLVYPVVDNDFETPSYQEHASAKPLNRQMMHWFWKHYLGEARASDFSCPLQSEDLAGLAPATVITAEIDPLCSEGERYADKLRSFDVPVSSRRFEGVTHEFFGLGAVLTEGREAVKFAAHELKRSFQAPAREERRAG